MKRSGSADLPLHYGHSGALPDAVKNWLAAEKRYCGSAMACITDDSGTRMLTFFIK